MPVQAMGPTFAGGTQPIVTGGYSVLYLPDVENARLQAAGEAPVFYYIPNIVRMARKDGPDTGDYLFNLIKFSGTQGDGVIGGGEGKEVAGGVLTFSVTGAIPEDVRRQAEGQITAQFQGSNDSFWGIRTAKAPLFRPAIITSSTTTLSNVSPTARGLPVIEPARNGRGSIVRATGMPGRPDGARSLPRVVREGEVQDTNLDAWYWQMHGEGAGSIDPTGTHAFSGLLGAYPTAIMWEGFHGTAAPLIAIQNYKLKVWSPVVTLTIKGNWDKVFDHFSAAASGRYYWASVDLKAELNNMRTNGTIEVDMKVDQTLPGAEEIAKQLDKKSDLVYEKFMEAAKKMIFDVPQPDVEAAEASSSGGSFSPWGAGFVVKYRRDTNSLSLDYHETRQFAYLQDHTVSGSLAGMYEDIKQDPEAERKYFLTVHLDDYNRKVTTVCRPVAAWADRTVEFMSVQIGYPNTAGELMWEGHAFSGSDGRDDSWKYAIAQKKKDEVQDAPEGWEPGLTCVKRKVHLAEPPSEFEDKYRRIQIEQNVVSIDPEPNGVLLSDTTLEVRADAAGRLAVGPIDLGVMLNDDTQTVEAIFEAVDGDTGEPVGFAPVRFSWEQSDQNVDRTWMIYTGDPAFRPYFRYKVIVTVKGTLFEPGRTWEGTWERASGNGPMVVRVPRPNDPGVVSRSMPDALSATTAGNGASSREAPSQAKENVPSPERTLHEYQV